LGLTEKPAGLLGTVAPRFPQKEKGIRYYDFRDLIGLRTVKQLVENGVPANRLRERWPRCAKSLLTRRLAFGVASTFRRGSVIVERGGTRLEPLSGSSC